MKADTGKARQGQKDFILKEQVAKMRQEENKILTDQTIVKSLYSLEVKLSVGQ